MEVHGGVGGAYTTSWCWVSRRLFSAGFSENLPAPLVDITWPLIELLISICFHQLSYSDLVDSYFNEPIPCVTVIHEILDSIGLPTEIPGTANGEGSHQSNGVSLASLCRPYGQISFHHQDLA